MHVMNDRRGTKMLRWIAAWLGATLASYVLGSLFMSQVVLAGLTRLGIEVDFMTRVAMSAEDIVGLSASYLPLVAIALLVGFLLASGIARFTPTLRTALHLLAGASATGMLIVIMTATFGMNPLAGATGATGISLQTLAGLVGAFVFLRIARVRT